MITLSILCLIVYVICIYKWVKADYDYMNMPYVFAFLLIFLSVPILLVLLHLVVKYLP
jgi:hypothetical protein